MLKEQIRTEIARIINASCIDPPTREEPDRPADCPADCGLCKADQILALFPQGDKIDGNALPSAAYDEYFTPPQGEGGHWIFKTDKLTPLQVMVMGVIDRRIAEQEKELRSSYDEKDIDDIRSRISELEALKAELLEGENG